jgi:hypothetical protein
MERERAEKLKRKAEKEKAAKEKEDADSDKVWTLRITLAKIYGALCYYMVLCF